MVLTHPHNHPQDYNDEVALRFMKRLKMVCTSGVNLPLKTIYQDIAKTYVAILSGQTVKISFQVSRRSQSEAVLFGEVLDGSLEDVGGLKECCFVNELTVRVANKDVLDVHLFFYWCNKFQPTRVQSVILAIVPDEVVQKVRTGRLCVNGYYYITAYVRGNKR